MPERIRVEIGPEETVTAMLYPAGGPDRVGVTVILGHGAGAGQTSAFMVEFAEGLASRGIDAATFNFSYTERGGRLPDPNDRLEACWRAVIAALRGRAGAAKSRIVIGGKSMGGRIATQVAAKGVDVAGIVLLGYPLHPPGRPEKERSRHLGSITVPMLFVQGSRDAFGTPDELRPVIDRLGAPVDLYVVDGGDHSFNVPKRAGIGQPQVYAGVLDRIAAWVRGLDAG